MTAAVNAALALEQAAKWQERENPDKETGQLRAKWLRAHKQNLGVSA